MNFNGSFSHLGEVRVEDYSDLLLEARPESSSVCVLFELCLAGSQLSAEAGIE